MNPEQVTVYKNRDQIHKILYKLFEKCYIDNMTGKFYCKLCDNAVHIDLSKKFVYCPIHGLLI